MGLAAHIMKSGCVKNRADAVRVGQRKGAGGAGLGTRRKRHVLSRGLKRHPNPIVLLQLLPAQETQSPPRTERGSQIAESLGSVLEEHDAETGKDQINAGRLELMRLGIGRQKTQILQLLFLLTLTSTPQHGTGDINSRHRAARTDPVCQGERGVSAAAAHVEHGLARLRRGLLQGNKSQRTDLGIEPLLEFDPLRPAPFVPIFNLLCVGVSVCHMLLRFLGLLGLLSLV